MSAICVVIEKWALFRGQRTGLTSGDGRKPIPPYLDRLFRLIFLLALITVPLCSLVSQWFWIPFVLYVPSYLDGSEKYRGRPNSFYKNMPCWSWFKTRLNLKLQIMGRLNPDKKVIIIQRSTQPTVNTKGRIGGVI